MSETKKNRGGRPRVDAIPITVRVPPSLLAALDKFLADQKSASRPDAIRTLLQDHLTGLRYLDSSEE